MGGNGLLARRIAAATPYAYLERRRLGIPTASVVVLEELGGQAADACDASPAELAAALARLAVSLHRRGVLHGDLKASHVHLLRRGKRLESRLLDLEGVRFPRRLPDRERMRALAQLNASLPDRMGSAPRRRVRR